MPINLKSSIKRFHVLSDFQTSSLRCTEGEWQQCTHLKQHLGRLIQIYFPIEGKQTIDTIAWKGYVLIFEWFGSRNQHEAANVFQARSFDGAVGGCFEMKCNHTHWNGHVSYTLWDSSVDQDVWVRAKFNSDQRASKSLEHKSGVLSSNWTAGGSRGWGEHKVNGLMCRIHV